MEPSNLERLASLSEAELWEEVGSDILDRDTAARNFYLQQRMTQRERAIAAAKAWFAANRDTLHDRICKNKKVRAAFLSDPGTIVELTKVIGDALLGLNGIFPIVTISMLIARKGLGFICGEDA